MQALMGTSLRGAKGSVQSMATSMFGRRPPVKAFTIPSKSGGLVSIRHGHAAYQGYRQPNFQPEIRPFYVFANIIGGFWAWWVLWHCYHEPGHLFGHFKYEDRFAYTDEELGIPHDSEGLAPTIEDPRTTIIPGVIRNHRWYGRHYLALFHDGDTGIFKM